MKPTRGALRRFWLNVHLWIGVALAILTVPIAISGALLVYHDELDTLLHPARYAVTGSQISQPSSAYLDGARKALGNGITPTMIRFDAEGGPVVVSARGRTPEGTSRRLNVYLDPPTANVLEVEDFRASMFGFLHVFHENLTIPQYSGRAIVGWIGVAMLISSLSGIYLWWPRNGAFRIGLRWRRSDSTNANLHHLLGFWISIPLAVVSLTGIYLGFPQQGRDLLSTVAPMTPRAGFGAPARQTALNPDQALAQAINQTPGAKPAALFLATGKPGEAPIWRIQLRDTNGDTKTLLVDDRSGIATPVVVQSGDTVSQWIRWIHEGSHSGPIWKLIVLLCGVLPPLFTVTGTIMWLRRRQRRSAVTHLRAAE